MDTIRKAKFIITEITSTIVFDACDIWKHVRSTKNSDARVSANKKLNSGVKFYALQRRKRREIFQKKQNPSSKYIGNKLQLLYP